MWIFRERRYQPKQAFDDNHSAWKLRTLRVAQDTDLQAFIKSGKPKESLCIIQQDAM